MERMNETLLPIKLRRDQVFGLFAHLPPSQADAVVDYFKECRAPIVLASKWAARLDRDGLVTVLFPGRLAVVSDRLSDYGATVVVSAAEAEPENRRYGPSVESLLALGDREARRFEREVVALPKFTAEDIPALIAMASDDELHRVPGNTAIIWAPLHAMSALGILRAEAAVGPLLEQLRRVDEDQDEFVGGAVTDALAAIGPAAVALTAAYLGDMSKGKWARVRAATALRMLGDRYDKVRDECVGQLTKQLASCAEQEPSFNGHLVGDLLDLKAVESAGVIEQAFASGRVDEMVAGDWEDVQIEFGFKQRRERPRKPTEFTEMGRKFRAALGLPELDELAGPGQPAEPLVLGQRPAAPLPTIVKSVPMRFAAKVGRNDPCPCGSRKKFKKCCGP